MKRSNMDFPVITSSRDRWSGRGGRRRTFMDEKLTRSRPFYGFDGVLCRAGRRVYIRETGIGALSGTSGDQAQNVPFRVLAIFWDANTSEVSVAAGRFRFVEDAILD